jgi:vancomycin permeability regulator SanA
MLRRILKLLLGLLALGAVVLALPRLLMAIYSLSRVFSPADVPAEPVAIVFGAGLRWDGMPTPVLRDRVATGVALYKAGKVQRLLMSGDNRSADYDEPSAMKRYALQLGVPEAAIVTDHAGLRTYDTCYRARAIFGVRQAILVTQDFHLPRALFTCNALGVTAVGVTADNYSYRRSSLAFWNLRETFASLAALWDVIVARPSPILGAPQPIFPPGA